jgi:hypothetical protein
MSRESRMTLTSSNKRHSCLQLNDDQSKRQMFRSLYTFVVRPWSPQSNC